MNKLRNIKISQTKESYPFTPVIGGGGERKIPPRKRYNHANYLQKQFETSWKSGEEENKKVASISSRNGIYLEFRGKKDNDRIEQKKWIEDLINRVRFNEDSNISICLLDKGVSNGHPLIQPVLEDKDMHTIFDDGIVQDISEDGHGTGMAGIATYFNLEELLESNDYFEINYKLESVRIIDDNIRNDSELYGAITSEAISLAEITNSDNKRIIAMAITAGFDVDADKKDKTKFKGDGKPTSWSAAIDNLALGNYGVDESSPRLIIISAGNTSESEIEEAGDYETAVALHSVEDPAQSWNALTIGAYTEKASSTGDSYIDNYKPLVEPGSYSPFNSSSLMWSDKWPIKPDIVLEGGNLGYNEESKGIRYSVFDHLSLLTANNKYHKGNYFTTMAMTSSATAQAANMAAKIVEVYPDIWPETIRALMVHSAEWTSQMTRQVFKEKKIKDITKTERSELLRLVGYGVPNLDRALYSARNSVNLVVEDEIQPFKEKRSFVTINEMSLHFILH
jgi:hypothetical protein